MPIEFLNSATGNSSDIVAEKLKVVELDSKKINDPYNEFVITPSQSEALNTGGGIYKFLIAQGEDEAGVRTGAKKNTTYEVADNTVVETFTLTVTQPHEWPKDGKIKTFQSEDAKEMDGVTFAPSITAGGIKALDLSAVNDKRTKLDAVIPSEANLVVKGKTRKITSTGTTALQVLTAAGQAGIDYKDLSPRNDSWKVTDTTGLTGNNALYPATRFFHQNEYSYEKSEVVYQMHPADIAKLSLVNTEAGAGSLPQFAQFAEGTLDKIVGFRVQENRRTPKGTIEIMVIGKVFAEPDPAVQTTKFFSGNFPFHDQMGMRGERYYDTMIPVPELVTVIDISSLAKTLDDLVKEGANLRANDAAVLAAAKKAEEAAPEAQAEEAAE